MDECGWEGMVELITKSEEGKSRWESVALLVERTSKCETSEC